MPAEFVGIENILKNLNRYKNFEGFAVYRGGKIANDVKSKPVIERMAEENETAEDLAEVFAEWCEDMLSNNPLNYQIYNVVLFEYPENSSKRKSCGTFCFQLTNQPANNSRTSSKMNHEISGEFVHKDTMLLAIENANLKNQLETLNDRLNALERIEEEEEEEEEEDNSIIGTLENSLKDKMPQIIDFVLGALSNNKPASNYATGIGSNVDEIINEFRAINPNIESDLFKLLQLAKTKPDLFNMLITQLRNM